MRGNSSTDIKRIIRIGSHEKSVHGEFIKNNRILEQSIYFNEHHQDAYDLLVFKRMSDYQTNLCFGILGGNWF